MDICIIWCCGTLLQQKRNTAVALVLDAISANIAYFPVFVVLTKFFIVPRTQICGFI